MRILQLPPDIANQIAAGEVIERPASIVKELLENALDANADNIAIEIGFGGLNQIKISDNGDGIVAEDLHLAIMAHATSKITKLNDLYAINSMGFRGEALASIASVARVSISSKPALQENGMRLECHGQQVEIMPFARNKGTTIDVRDIFYNAPVRKKFLNSEKSEFQAIDILVKRFALGSLAIAIHLSHNGKLHWQVPAALDEPSRLLRMNKLLGKAFVSTAIYVDAEHAGIRLSGWVSGPGYQRSQNDRLWVYVNGRMVKDKLINHAIRLAYENQLHHGRNPACLLYLTINPGLVDVNVHPTKHEVRFQQPRIVHDFISSELQNILYNTVFPGFSASDDALCAKPLQLCEAENPHIYTPGKARLETDRSTAVTVNERWFELNEHFSVMAIDGVPYLVNVVRLQKCWLIDCLNEAPLPLPRRPLLVPVHVDRPLMNAGAFQAMTEFLHQIGMEVACQGDGKLAVRSLPLLVPDLDIKSFLRSCFTVVNPTIRHLFELLAENQMFAVESIGDALRAQYKDYLKAVMPARSRAFSKQLSVAICQDILNAE